jgi:predicted RNase H-like nuclease (RuvC/YqgF family)
MGQLIVPAIFTLAGIVVTALVTYFVAKRNTSGRVDTSDAKTLWEEATRLREAYKEEVSMLRTEGTNLRSEVNRLRAELEMLRATAQQLREDAEGWRKAALAEGMRKAENDGLK